MNFPEEYLIRMKEMLGDSYPTYVSHFAGDGYGQTLRMNTLKAEPADFIRRFLLVEEVKQVPWTKDGYYYLGEERLSVSPFYHAGAFYLQEPSAMAPASYLPVRPGDKVLDLCAAPGGKSFALAGKLHGEGLLVSNDISASRAKTLLKNLERAGAANILVSCEDPARLAGRWKGYFDAVLVDAPCSGEGMFRKEPRMAQEWSLSEVKRYAKLQSDLLDLAAEMVRPGGYLLYSTCTYSEEENEDNVAYFLHHRPDYELCPLPESEGVESGRKGYKHCRRFWSHLIEGEGQFAALFRKSEDSERENHKPDHTFKNIDIKKCAIPEPMEEFLSHIRGGRSIKKRIYMNQDKAYLLPEACPDFKRLRMLRTGLFLGECKKKRFEPSQALAMALKPEDYDGSVCLPIGDDRVIRYLKGETIMLPEKEGDILFCVEDFPLGWGKCSGGRMKNKYQPAWRMQ